MKNYIRDVIDRYIKHDYPAEVDRDFRVWLIDEERADEKDSELSQLWEATESATTPNYQHSLERMRELTGIKTRQKVHTLHTRLVIWKIAAALLIAVSAGSIYLALQNRQAPDLLQAYIPTTEMQNITLSDGTQVMINSESTLLYPQQFTGDSRCVYLVGEANFKVRRDEAHPFIVKSADFQVTALGTEFNVRSYSPTDVRVTLITGKVAVSDTCGVHSVEMVPGQSAQLSSDGTFAMNEVDIESFLYWKEGFFYFDDVALVDMMKEIGRWYNIDIEFRNSKIMDLRMHFFANRHQDIFHLIELLNRMERIHAYFEAGKLIIE